MLDAYEERFQLLDDLVRIRMREEGLLRAPRHLRGPGGKRKSRLKPRAKRGIMTPIARPLAPWDTGSVVRRETARGPWEPSTAEEVQREILHSRVRAILRDQPQPSAEDLQNFARMPPQSSSSGGRPRPSKSSGVTRHTIPGPDPVTGATNRIFRQDSRSKGPSLLSFSSPDPSS